MVSVLSGSTLGSCKVSWGIAGNSFQAKPLEIDKQGVLDIDLPGLRFQPFQDPCDTRRPYLLLFSLGPLKPIINHTTSED